MRCSVLLVFTLASIIIVSSAQALEVCALVSRAEMAAVMGKAIAAVEPMGSRRGDRSRRSVIFYPYNTPLVFVKNTPCSLSVQCVATVGPLITGTYADRRKPPSDSGRLWTSALGRIPTVAERPKAVSGIPFDRKQSQLAFYALRFDEPLATHTYDGTLGTPVISAHLSIGSRTPQAC